ncbi:MAG TPA: 6-bladed beta-propeller [Anaeromyxobacteraceae bacterium]|nr:6-bladed beta-propeller [Anaeromyxobacteraceae bacterium]
MRRAPHWLLAAALLGSAAGCSHARARDAAAEKVALAAVAWPAPPASPRVRLAAVLPDRAAVLDARPWWRKALDWVTGADADDAERALVARPFGVAFADDRSLVVADPDSQRVLRLGSSGGAKALECGEVRWSAPMGVTVDAAGAVWVADAAAGQVVRWTASRCAVFGRGELERPTGVAVAPDRIWVVDPPRHQLVAFSTAGAILARVGERGDGEGRFNYPSGVSRAPSGELLVVDALNFRVVRLAADGRWLGAFGAPGDEGGALARPKAAVADAAGTVYVSDAQRDQVLVFGPDGAFSYAIGETGTGPGRLAHPAGLALQSGRLAVADSQNQRVQIFEILGGNS